MRPTQTQTYLLLTFELISRPTILWHAIYDIEKWRGV